MSTIASHQFALTRIADFARSLSRLHRMSHRRPVDDDQIDRAFNAVCISIWGYTTDDFNDDLLSIEDHAWLDTLDEARGAPITAQSPKTLTLAPKAALVGAISPNEAAAVLLEDGSRTKKLVETVRRFSLRHSQ